MGSRYRGQMVDIGHIRIHSAFNHTPYAMHLGAWGLVVIKAVWNMYSALRLAGPLPAELWDAHVIADWTMFDAEPGGTEGIQRGMAACENPRAQVLCVLDDGAVELLPVEGLVQGLHPRRVIGSEQYHRIAERDGHRCQYCGVPVSVFGISEGHYLPINKGRPWKMHIDHVIPVSRGGTDLDGNLVAACYSCNMNKKAKLLWTEWEPYRPTLELLERFPRPEDISE